MLDKHCLKCHDFGKKGAAKVVLSGDRTLSFNFSYMELWYKGYVGAIGAEPAGHLPAYSWGAHASRLIRHLRKGHQDVKLSREDFDRLVTWVDLNGPYYPTTCSTDGGGGRILCYFRSLDEFGDSWTMSSWKEVDRAKVIEDVQLTSMGDDTLIPVISYIAFDVTLDPYGYAGGVRIARADDIDGYSWDTPDEIVTYDGSADSEVIDGLSLVKLGDLPAISFVGKLAAEEGCFLYYMASDSPYGLSWPDPPLAISPELASHVAHSSIGVIEGRPAIALAAYHRYSLEYTRAEDAAGDAWPADLDLVDDGVGIKVPCQLLEVDGRPAICYMDYNDTDVKYAIYY